jgi:hypothetical protein
MSAAFPRSLVTTISVGPASMSMAQSKSDQTLGGGDIEIAGADDLVDARNVCGPVGQCGDGVRAAEAIELRDAEEMRGGESFRCGLG